MKALLKKDFYSQRKYILMLMVSYIIANIGLRLVKKDYSSYPTISGSIVMIGTCVIMDDLLKKEKDEKSLAYTLAMPVSKKDYVNEKLIFSLVIIFFIFLSSIISILILNYISGVNLFNKEFFIETLINSSLAFAMVNLGIRWYSFAGEGAFLLSMFANTFIFGVLGTAFFSLSESGRISVSTLSIIYVISYILFNDLIRRSSIKNMEKVRF